MEESKKLKAFGMVIKKYRLYNELTQQQLADLLGVSRNTVIGWERNTARPDVETIQELARVLGIPLYELFDLPSKEASENEVMLLSFYRQLDNAHQLLAAKIIQDLLESQKNSCPEEPHSEL